MSNMEKFSISKAAFEGMRNLQFLQIYSQMGQQNENVSCLHIEEDLEYLPRLRLLSWNFYPGKSLPPTFKPERLVELHMQFSNLEKLWDGVQVSILIFFAIYLLGLRQILIYMKFRVSRSLDLISRSGSVVSGYISKYCTIADIWIHKNNLGKKKYFFKITRW